MAISPPEPEPAGETKIPVVRLNGRAYCTAFHDGVEVTQLNASPFLMNVSEATDILMCDVGDVVKNTSDPNLPWGTVVVHKDGTVTYCTAVEEYTLTEDDIFVTFKYIS